MDVNVAADILNRLPMRSLLRFKCVSKLGMTLILEPYFSMKHLNHARNDKNSQKILVNQWDYYSWRLGYNPSSEDRKNLKIDDKSYNEILVLKIGS
ncbi:hypothetical protein H5410_001872 [Solanum commersonii]|uniref:F-box domain-containing protein n=1 Tax=Solanum commersonii TaxID=4109 RepID=A0A9J6B0U1_SOLCO|nr:hypothetical protein H5410_001872 [Solanum commersonii]